MGTEAEMQLNDTQHRRRTPEERAIVSWRLDQLLRAGFALADARVVATHRQVDLHNALDLVRRGCPPATALRILL
ncbi:MAG TPA: hypothetical protein VE615_13000 [Gaiellaceae bacterium]|jgi:hypothetical protein|nr:hypothetical protein [Gaiellaceae bacterium]